MPTPDYPRSFGPYVLLERLGQGGMSEVDLARRAVDDADYVRFLVIKRIHAQHAGDGSFIRMFHDEARINAELQHALRYSRSIDLGSVSNEIATQSVDYRIDYAGFERSKLYLGVFWNEGVESGAFNPESYDRWAFQTGFGYPLSRKLEFLVELEHSLRESSLAGRSFDRNLVSLKLTYDF